jgi:hypothetical protein
MTADRHLYPAPRPTAREVIERRLREGTLDPALIRIVDDDGGVAIVGVPARPDQPTLPPEDRPAR